jgi:sugar (pentulose or hexulose) kinase
MALANLIGIDETTSARAIAVRRDDGKEGFAVRDMKGQKKWRDDQAYPGFDLTPLPGMLLKMFDKLQLKEFPLAESGRVSISCRQHDLVILGSEGEMLLPAISWECNAASAEAKRLNSDPDVTKAVGTVQPRLILPKLIHLLAADSSLRGRIWRVLTTGDYVAYLLTGEMRLHKSEAMSNGLYDRLTGGLPVAVLKEYGLDPEWFPPLIDSGQPVGQIGSGEPLGLTEDWMSLRERLAGWEFIAGLGDNHASAVGCGVRDSKALLTSLGTSGTNNWVHEEAPASKEILGFSFYQPYLWLTMLPRCASWYNAFVEEFTPRLADKHERLNRLASRADAADLVRVEYHSTELYPPGWTRLSRKVQIASVQFSIVLELLLRIRTMLRQMESQKLTPPTEFILTGGLSQSEFVQHVYHVGVRLVAGDDCRVLLSGRSGPLKYKTTAYGALVNAEFHGDVAAVPESRFPTSPCPGPSDRAQYELLNGRLRPYLGPHAGTGEG